MINVTLINVNAQQSTDIRRCWAPIFPVKIFLFSRNFVCKIRVVQQMKFRNEFYRNISSFQEKKPLRHAVVKRKE